MTKEEFEELVGVYRHRLVKSAVRKWGGDGEDAIQEALLRTYADLDNFKHECSFSSWVMAIAKHVIAEGKRKEKLEYADVDVLDLPDSDCTYQSAFAAEWLESLTPAEMHSVLEDVGRSSKHRARKKWYENS